MNNNFAPLTSVVIDGLPLNTSITGVRRIIRVSCPGLSLLDIQIVPAGTSATVKFATTDSATKCLEYLTAAEYKCCWAGTEEEEPGKRVVYFRGPQMGNKTYVQSVAQKFGKVVNVRVSEGMKSQKLAWVEFVRHSDAASCIEHSSKLPGCTVEWAKTLANKSKDKQSKEDGDPVDEAKNDSSGHSDTKAKARFVSKKDSRASDDNRETVKSTNEKETPQETVNSTEERETPQETVKDSFDEEEDKAKYASIAAEEEFKDSFDGEKEPRVAKGKKFKRRKRAVGKKLYDANNGPVPWDSNRNTDRDFEEDMSRLLYARWGAGHTLGEAPKDNFRQTSKGTDITPGKSLVQEKKHFDEAETSIKRTNNVVRGSSLTGAVAREGLQEPVHHKPDILHLLPVEPNPWVSPEINPPLFEYHHIRSSPLQQKNEMKQNRREEPEVASEVPTTEDRHKLSQGTLNPPKTQALERKDQNHSAQEVDKVEHSSGTVTPTGESPSEMNRVLKAVQNLLRVERNQSALERRKLSDSICELAEKIQELQVESNQWALERGQLNDSISELREQVQHLQGELRKYRTCE